MYEQIPSAKDANSLNYTNQGIGEAVLEELKRDSRIFDFEDDALRIRIIPSELYEHPKYPGPLAAAVITDVAYDEGKPTVTWALGYGEHAKMFKLQAQNNGRYGVPIQFGTNNFEVLGYYANILDFEKVRSHSVLVRFFGDDMDFDASLPLMREFVDKQAEVFRKFSEKYYPGDGDVFEVEAIFTDFDTRVSRSLPVDKV